MYAFDGVGIVRTGRKKNIEEISLEDFVDWDKSDKPILVGKRSRRTIFSVEVLNKRLLNGQARLIKKRGIKIVNMVRDGRDVVLSTVSSKQRSITPRRWIHSMRHRDMFPKLITVEVRYEDLVTRPDAEQRRVADALGLKAIHAWSEYPEFVPGWEFKMRGSSIDPGGRYVARPLSGNRVGKNLEAYKAMTGEGMLRRHFEAELRKAGYIL